MMDWGPGVSGLIGGLVASGLSYLLRGQAPRGLGGRSAESLIAEYRWHIRAVGLTFFASLCGAIFMFAKGWVPDNDWRLFFAAFGGGLTVPLAVLYLWLGRERFAEFWVASCAKDDVPPWLARWLACLCAVAFLGGLGGYLWSAL